MHKHTDPTLELRTETAGQSLPYNLITQVSTARRYRTRWLSGHCVDTLPTSSEGKVILVERHQLTSRKVPQAQHVVVSGWGCTTAPHLRIRTR